MTRSLHLFNALLALVAVALGTAAVRTVFDRPPAAVAPPPATMEPAAGAAAEATTPENVGPDLTAAPPDESDIILRQHPFGTPLPEAARLPDPPRVAPPPAPLPTLLGTLRVGDESRALLKDGSRTDLFAVGDSVAGGTLVEIHTDRVIIKRGETLGEVPLKSTIREMEPRSASADSPATLQSAPTSEPTEPRASRRQRSRQRPPAAPQTPAADGR